MSHKEKLKTVSFVLKASCDSYFIDMFKGLPGRCSAGDRRDMGSIPRSERYPGERERLPIPVFLPGKPHGQGSLVSYSLWVTESDTTERACPHTMLCRLRPVRVAEQGDYSVIITLAFAEPPVSLLPVMKYWSLWWLLPTLTVMCHGFSPCNGLCFCFYFIDLWGKWGFQSCYVKIGL